MTGPILVVNPNSSVEVTQGIRDALRPLALASGPQFECMEIAESPATLNGLEETARAGLAVARIARDRPDISAMVIACFGDPGLAIARSVASCPVLGIMEAGTHAALSVAERFGVISISPGSVPRHLKAYREMGVLDRLAGDEPLPGVSAADAGGSDAVLDMTIAAGRKLVANGAGCILLGCAGFSPRRTVLQRELGVPVVDPVLSAAMIARSLGGA